MGTINTGRVVLGGLVAGLVINAGEFILNEPLLGDHWALHMQSLGLEAPSGGAIGVFVAEGFVLGIVAVWLYAAIRPRFGVGIMTALIAGLAVWFLAIFYQLAALTASNVIPWELATFVVFWDLVEIPLATVAGAWLYQERTAGPAPAPTATDAST